MVSLTPWWRSLSRYNKAFALFVALDVVLLTAVVIQPRTPPPREAVLNVVPAPTARPSVATRAPVTARPTATPTPGPTPTPTPTPEPTPAPTPIPYKDLTVREWAQLVKAPDDHLFERYKVWACITQFDAATGAESFRGNASWTKEQFWIAGENSLFLGNGPQLADFVADDVVFMNVTVGGSFSYDTTIGGNVTVPMFYVDEITNRGSCG